MGHESIDDTPESEMTCKNQLCYMTGNNDLVFNKFNLFYLVETALSCIYLGRSLI